MSWAIAIIAAIGLVFGATFVGLSVGLAWTNPGPAIYAVSVVGIIFFGGLSVGCADLLRRSRDQVATDAQGLWYLPKWSAVRYIAWPDVASVRADTCIA